MSSKAVDRAPTAGSGVAGRAGHLPHRFSRVTLAALATSLALALLSSCGTNKPTASDSTGLAELMERPAERALFEGIRAYDDGQYAPAEAALRKSLGGGLRSGRDQASAHKLLAFITCSTERVRECENAFRAARAADPRFALSKQEAGHPLWGPVYRKTLP
jgi:Tfp pilus assembly protein PilF